MLSTEKPFIVILFIVIVTIIMNGRNYVSFICVLMVKPDHLYPMYDFNFPAGLPFNTLSFLYLILNWEGERERGGGGRDEQIDEERVSQISEAMLKKEASHFSLQISQDFFLDVLFSWM